MKSLWNHLQLNSVKNTLPNAAYNDFMSAVKKYTNVPITYSPDDKLLDTKLFQDIGRAVREIRQSKRKTGLTGMQKIFAEKKAR
jgi:hypothetical protein